MSTPKIVSFINMKGGVGKTTTSINIADTLVKHFKKNVLVIDMDPQFNATQALFSSYLGIKFYENLLNEKKTIASVLMSLQGSGVTQEVAAYTSKDLIQELHREVDKQTGNSASLYMLPGDLELIDYESSKRGAEKILSSYIEDDILINFDLDYVIIDTPATYSIYSQAALIASESYIVPIAPDVFSTLGYSILHKIMRRDLTLRGHNLINAGIIFTLDKPDKVRRTAIYDKFKEEPQFKQKLSEFEPIRTGKLSTLIYDMDFTREEIVTIANEFITRVK